MLTSKRGGSFMFVKMEKQTNQTTKRKYLQIAQFCSEILCSIHLILIITHAVCENAFFRHPFSQPQYLWTKQMASMSVQNEFNQVLSPCTKPNSRTLWMKYQICYVLTKIPCNSERKMKLLKTGFIIKETSPTSAWVAAMRSMREQYCKS